MQSPPVLSESQAQARSAKRWIVATFVVSGLVIVAWPLLAFTSIFIFDSPIRSAFDAAMRYSVFLSIVLFPVVWSLALFFSLRRLRHGATRAAWVFTLAPVALIALVVLVFLLSDWLGLNGA